MPDYQTSTVNQNKSIIYLNKDISIFFSPWSYATLSFGQQERLFHMEFLRKSDNLIARHETKLLSFIFQFMLFF